MHQTLIMQCIHYRNYIFRKGYPKSEFLLLSYKKSFISLYLQLQCISLLFRFRNHSATLMKNKGIDNKNKLISDSISIIYILSLFSNLLRKEIYLSITSLLITISTYTGIMLLKFFHTNNLIILFFIFFRVKVLN